MRLSIGPVLLLAVLAAGCDRRSASGGQASDNVTVAVSKDEVLPSGGMAMVPKSPAKPAAGDVDHSHKGEAAPAFAFQDQTGRPTTIAALHGTPVLVNLWATWCGPCIKELPTLAALSARQGAKLKVVALSQDTDPGKVSSYIAAHALTTLPVYTDARGQWLATVTSNLPTSILYDAQGKEVWRVTGDLDWTGDFAGKAIGEAGA